MVLRMYLFMLLLTVEMLTQNQERDIWSSYKRTLFPKTDCPHRDDNPMLSPSIEPLKNTKLCRIEHDLAETNMTSHRKARTRLLKKTKAKTKTRKGKHYFWQDQIINPD